MDTFLISRYAGTQWYFFVKFSYILHMIHFQGTEDTYTQIINGHIWSRRTLPPSIHHTGLCPAPCKGHTPDKGTGGSKQVLAWEGVTSVLPHEITFICTLFYPHQKHVIYISHCTECPARVIYRWLATHRPPHTRGVGVGYK